MVEKKSKILTYPTLDRLQRQKIGGVLFLVFGLILITFGLIICDTFWSFCGLPLAIIGFFINGYRNVVQIDQASENVRYYRGFYFFVKKYNYQFNSFDKIIIRKSTFLSSRFSNTTNRTYEGTINVKYKLFLAGNNEIAIDSSSEKELVKQWAEQISKTLNLNIHFEEEKLDQEKTVYTMAVMKWVSIIFLLIVLCVMAFVLYQLFTIE